MKADIALILLVLLAASSCTLPPPNRSLAAYEQRSCTDDLFFSSLETFGFNDGDFDVEHPGTQIISATKISGVCAGHVHNYSKNGFTMDDGRLFTQSSRWGYWENAGVSQQWKPGLFPLGRLLDGFTILSPYDDRTQPGVGQHVYLGRRQAGGWYQVAETVVVDGRTTQVYPTLRSRYEIVTVDDFPFPDTRGRQLILTVRRGRDIIGVVLEQH